jgi:hypothetical protein
LDKGEWPLLISKRQTMGNCAGHAGVGNGPMGQASTSSEWTAGSWGGLGRDPATPPTHTYVNIRWAGVTEAHRTCA